MGMAIAGQTLGKRVVNPHDHHHVHHQLASSLSASTTGMVSQNTGVDAIRQAQSQLQQLISGSLDDLEDAGSSTSTAYESSEYRAHQARQQQHHDHQQTTPPHFIVTSIYHYDGIDPNHLAFGKGDYIEVTRTEPTGWWDGILLVSKTHPKGTRGWFPSNFVRRVVNEQRRTPSTAPAATTSYAASNSMTSRQHINPPASAYTSGHFPLSASSSSSSLPFDANLDLLLGRRGSSVQPADIEQVLRMRSARSTGLEDIIDDDEDDGVEDEDLTSFSTGGDIFSEIAAAAAAASSNFTASQRIPQSHRAHRAEADGGIYGEDGASTGRLPQPRYHRQEREREVPTNKKHIAIDGDWVPKVSTDGRIVYYNTRSGDSAFELPSPSVASSSTYSVHSPRTDLDSVSTNTPNAQQVSHRTAAVTTGTATAKSISPSVALVGGSLSARSPYNDSHSLGTDGYIGGSSNSSAELAAGESFSSAQEVLLSHSQQPSQPSENSLADGLSRSISATTMSRDNSLGGMGNGRAISMYSDDSALDADFSLPPGEASRRTGTDDTTDAYAPSMTPRKVSAATEHSLETEDTAGPFADLQAADVPTDPAHQVSIERWNTLMQLTQIGRAPSLAELRAQSDSALADLSQAIARPPPTLSPDAPSDSDATFEEQEAQNRRAVEVAALHVNTAVQNLLLAADVSSEPILPAKRLSAHSMNARASPRSSLNLTTASGQSTLGSRPSSLHSASFKTVPPLTANDFRSLAMKVAATESKLMLSIRTAWCLLATSPEEEQTLHANQDLDNPSEEDITIMRHRRAALIASRAENAAKLRKDVGLQIKTLAKSIDDLLSRIEAFAQENGIHADQEHLLAPQKYEAEVSADPAALLLPIAQVSSVLRGHGYTKTELTVPSSRRTSLATPSILSHSRSLRDSRSIVSPSLNRTLSPATLAELGSSKQELTEELAGVRTVLRTLLSSSLSDKSLKPAFLSTVTAQAAQLFGRVGGLLKDVEDVDIASRLDIEVTPELFAILTAQHISGVLSLDAFSRSDDATSSPDAAGYAESTTQAISLLQQLAETKQRLRVTAADFIANAQSLTCLPPLSPGPASELPLPSQPLSAAPLPYLFDVTDMAGPTVSTLVDCLDDVGKHSNRLLGCLNEILVLSDKQDTMPAELRRLNIALREHLNESVPVPASSAMVPTTSSNSSRLAKLAASAGLGVEDELAEELEVQPGYEMESVPPNGAATADPNKRYSGSSSLRNSVERGQLGAPALIRTNSGQSSIFKQQRQKLLSLRSRSNSVADSYSSDTSYARRDAAEDLRLAMQEAGIHASPPNTVPSTQQSPSKSKLKQFFGADAPGSNIHRPPKSIARDATPRYLEPDYTHDQISYASDGSIRAGTLHALVCRLTNHMSADTNFNNAFLMTYRTFTNSDELLDRLKARYRIEPPQNITPEELVMWTEQKQKLIRIRVENVLRSWITDYLYDEDEGQILGRMAAFAVTMSPESQALVTRLIERRRMTGAPRRLTASVSSGNAPAPIVPRNLKKIKLLELDPTEIARQFTIKDSKLFLKITPEECLSKAWPKKFNREMPNFKAITDMSNAVTGWVAITICAQTDVRRRAAIIKQFIAIADKCRQLSNYTTLMQILAGLNCSAIHRLRRTWELVNQKSTSTLAFMGALMSPENNHAMYRDALRLVGSPCVPFLGIYFTDWVMSGEANSDMLRDKPDQINFAKRARVVESIQQIQLQQATPYNFRPVDAIQRWIDEELEQAKVMAKDVRNPKTGEPDLMTRAYDLSLAIEPREREDERIARLLSESGFL